MRNYFVILLLFTVVATVAVASDFPQAVKVKHSLSYEPNPHGPIRYLPSQSRAAYPERLLEGIRGYTIGIIGLADDTQVPRDDSIMFLPNTAASYGIHYRRAGVLCHRKAVMNVRMELNCLATTHLGLRYNNEIIDLRGIPEKSMKVLPNQVSWQLEHPSLNLQIDIDVVSPFSVPAYGYIARVAVKNNSDAKIDVDLINWLYPGSSAGAITLEGQKNEFPYTKNDSPQDNQVLKHYVMEDSNLYLHDTNYTVLAGFDGYAYAIGQNALVKPLHIEKGKTETAYLTIFIDSPGYDQEKVKTQIETYFAKNPGLTVATAKRMTEDALDTYARIVVNGDRMFQIARGDGGKAFDESVASAQKGVYRNQTVSFELPDQKMQAFANLIANDLFPGLFQPPGFVHDAKYADYWNYIFCYRHVHAASNLGLEDQAMDYMRLLSANQLDNGRISSIRANFYTPAHPTEFDASYIDALYHYYKWTGDLDAVREVWDVVVRAAEYIDNQLDQDGDFLYRDHLHQWKSDFDDRGPSSSFQTSIVWKAYTDLAEFANKLGDDQKAKQYTEKAQNIRNAAQKHLWSDEMAMFGPRGPLDMLRLHPQSLEVEIPVWTQLLDPYQSYVMTDWYFANNKVVDPQGGIWMCDTDWWPAVWSQHVPSPGDYMMLAWARMLTGYFDEGYRCLQAVASGSFRHFRPGFDYMFDEYGRQGGGDPATAQGAWTRALVEGIFGIRPHIDENHIVITPRTPKGLGHYTFDRPGLKIECDFTQLNKKMTVQTESDIYAKLQIPVKMPVTAVLLDGKPVDYTIERAMAHGFVTLKTQTGGGTVDVQTQAKNWHVRSPLSARPGDTIDIKIQGIDSYKVDDRFSFFDVISKDNDTLKLKLKKAACGRATVFLNCQKSNLKWIEPISLWTMPRTLREVQPRTVIDPIAEDARFMPLDISDAFTDDIQTCFEHQFKTDAVDTVYGKIGYWSMPPFSLKQDIPKKIRIQEVPFVLGPMGPGEAQKQKDLIMICNTPPNKMPSTAKFQFEPQQLQKIYLLSLNMNLPQKSYVPAVEVIVHYQDGSSQTTELTPPLNFDSYYQDCGINTVAFPVQTEPVYGVNGSVPCFRFTLDQMHLTMTDIICDPNKQVEAIELKSIATETFMGLAGITLLQAD